MPRVRPTVLADLSDVHDELKKELFRPANTDKKSPHSFSCGCLRRDEGSVIFCTYHAGWYDALSTTTAMRTMGAGR